MCLSFHVKLVNCLVPGNVSICSTSCARSRSTLSPPEVVALMDQLALHTFITQSSTEILSVLTVVASDFDFFIISLFFCAFWRSFQPARVSCLCPGLVRENDHVSATNENWDSELRDTRKEKKCHYIHKCPLPLAHFHVSLVLVRGCGC